MNTQWLTIIFLFVLSVWYGCRMSLWRYRFKRELKKHCETVEKFEQKLEEKEAAHLRTLCNIGNALRPLNIWISVDGQLVIPKENEADQEWPELFEK